MNKHIVKVVVGFLFIILAFQCKSFAQSISEIAEEVGKSVVMIVVYDATGSVIGQGSGVFIRDDGIILTNAHVLKDAYSAEVNSSIGTFEKVSISYRDENVDLALIKVSTSSASCPSFAEDTDFKPGQRVIAIGNPLGLEKTVSDGLISGVRHTKDGIELIQTTVPISPGSSGGVLLNEIGQVIGITTSTFQEGQNINFAISLNTILTFFSAYVQYDPKGTKFQELKTAKESIWYIIIFKWVGKVFLFLLSALFGETFYFALPLTVLSFYAVYYIGIGLWWIISTPIKKTLERIKIKSNQGTSNLLTFQSSTDESYSSEDQTQFVDNLNDNNEENDSTNEFVYYCSSCGHRYIFPDELRGQEIKCVSCKKQIIVPIETSI